MQGIDWDQDEFVRRIGEFDGLVVRSAARVTAEVIEARDALKVIGRAGVGVDNIDVEAATRRGIVVVNAPQSNVLSAAEHTIAMIMACARNIPQAHARSRPAAGRSRSGAASSCRTRRSASSVSAASASSWRERAEGLSMHVVAYDPYVPVERFRELDLERAESPETVYREADFITVHLPKNAETLGFVDDEAFARMKDGVRVVNVARGGIIDEGSLARAIESGKVAAAGVDVFPVEPTTDDLLLAYDAVVVTPHLGASTAEASVRAGTIIAEQVSAALRGELASNAVNVPLVPGEEADELMPILPVVRGCSAELVTQLADGPVEDLEITYEGNVARYDTRILTVAVLEGVLRNTVEDEVNFVSAAPMAEERGISYREEKKPVVTDFLNLVTVTAYGGAELIVAGTTLGPRHRPRFVTVYGLDLDIEPVEHMIFVRAQSPAPGTFGTIGTLLGGFGVNVSQVSVAKAGEGEPDVMGLALDAPVH